MSKVQVPPANYDADKKQSETGQQHENTFGVPPKTRAIHELVILVIARYTRDAHLKKSNVGIITKN